MLNYAGLNTPHTVLIGIMTIVYFAAGNSRFKAVILLKVIERKTVIIGYAKIVLKILKLCFIGKLFHVLNHYSYELKNDSTLRF